MKRILFKSAAVVAAVIWGSIEAQAAWVYDSTAKTLADADTGYSFTVGEVTLTDPSDGSSVTGFEIKSKAPSTASGDLDFTNVATETGTGKNVISLNKDSIVNDVTTCTKLVAPHVMKICRNLCNGNKIIQSVTLSDKIEVFYLQCFNGTTSLTDFSPRVFPYVKSLVEKMNNNTRDLQFCNSAITGELSFPNVTNVGTKVFNGASKLTAISLPKVEEIMDGAFEKSGLVGDLYFAELKKLGSYPFKNCQKITSFTAPKLEVVGSAALQICYALTNVSVGAAANYGDLTFFNCSKLVSLTPWPTFNNITNTYDAKGNIGFNYNPIKGCSALVGAIELSGPAGLHTIQNDWMQGCNGITSITIRTPWVTNVVRNVATSLAPGVTIYWNTQKAPKAFGNPAFTSKDGSNRSRIIVKNDTDGWKAISGFVDAATLSAKDSTNRVDWPGKKTFGLLHSSVWLVEASKSFVIRIQ